MSENVRAHLIISGRVQGVCFRAEAEREATDRGLTGWVRHTETGKVEAVFEGERQAVERMIGWCRQGPPAARVAEVGIEWEPYRGDIPDFRIAR